MKSNKFMNKLILLGLFLLLVLSILLPRLNSINVDPRGITKYNPTNIAKKYYDDYNYISFNDLKSKSDLILKVTPNNIFAKYRDDVYTESKVISVLKGDYDKEYITIKESYQIWNGTYGAYYQNDYNECLPMIWDEEYYLFLKLNDNGEYEYTIREYGRFNAKGDIILYNREYCDNHEDSKTYDLIGFELHNDFDDKDEEFLFKYSSYLLIRKELLNSMIEWEEGL